MDMKKTVIYYYMSMAIIGASIVLLLYIFSMLRPRNIIDIENADAVQVDKQVYHPGDRITYKLDYCKYKYIAGDVHRALVDGTRIDWTMITSDVPKGCYTLSRNDLVIPEYVGTDTYHISTLIEFKVNPLQTVRVQRRSIDFRVEALVDTANDEK